MRRILGVVSLLTALLVSGLLVKKQQATQIAVPISSVTKHLNASVIPSEQKKLLQTQGQQIQDQVRLSIDVVMQRSRTVDDE